MALFKLLGFFFVLTQNLLVSLFLAFLLFGQANFSKSGRFCGSRLFKKVYNFTIQPLEQGTFPN